ncbi:gem-associated protein 8-like [Lytechinus pictus]|uniref:gem-associated protein 8-like n=1 Tax=Lytechinus pictus TaxID=7653 RepID=UPI0030B9DCB4
MSKAVRDEDIDGTVDENSSDGPWYSDPIYERYWNHYKKMKTWMQDQKPVQDSLMNVWMASFQQYLHHYQWWMYQNSMMSRTFPQHHLHHSFTPSPWHSYPLRTHHHRHHDNFFHSHHPYKPHPGATKYRVNKQYVTDQSDVDYSGFSETPQDDDDEGQVCAGGEEEEFEVELSEEMRQFFLQSQKHREELKELKLALNQKKPVERTKDVGGTRESTNEDEPCEDEFEITFTSSKKNKKKHILGAPVEQPGRRRAEEMKILYGKDSPAIHGMETAIQMQFDRNCDKKQPAFWPTVPLKM